MHTAQDISGLGGFVHRAPIVLTLSLPVSHSPLSSLLRALPALYAGIFYGSPLFNEALLWGVRK